MGLVCKKMEPTNELNAKGTLASQPGGGGRDLSTYIIAFMGSSVRVEAKRLQNKKKMKF